jgi:N-acetyltransferase 10
MNPPKIDYLGTSYGVTKNLFKFWRKNKFEPVYIRQTRNDVTA